MEAACARLRDDLVISRQEADGQPVCVVKNPETGRFFRFGEVEGFILQQLDGATPLEAVQKRVEERFEVSLSQEELAQFAEGLGKAGLVEDEREDGPPASPARQGRIRGDLFYLRLKAFDPDYLFGWLIGRIRFLFSRPFVFFSAVSIVLALWVTVTNWPELTRDLYRLYRPGALFLAWVTLLLVITAHEFAHGLTCKHFGGRVHEIGFMLIFFNPAFYCNVSDAWLFPEKYKRLWVTFAGAYFEMFLWAVAIFTWRVSDPHTTVSYLALIVVATSGIKTMFNLNPLIKLDGYYLLSDLLGIPNLKPRASGYLRDRLGLLWGATPWRVMDVTTRERWLYLIYGLLSVTFIAWMLSYLALWFGGFLVSRYQGWGFVLFAGLLMGAFRKRIAGLFQTVLSWFRNPVAFIKRPLRFFIVLAILMAVSFLWHIELKVPGTFIIRPVHNADVRAEVEGIIQDIYVDMGDMVHKDDPVARLSGDEYHAELQSITADITEKYAQLRLLKAGPKPEEVNLEKTRVAMAEEQLTYAKGDLERDKALFERELLSRKEFEQVQELVAVREREREEASNKLKVLLAGSRQEEVDILDAEIEGLKGRQHYLEVQLQALIVASPITGWVTTHNLKEKIGQYMKKGDLIAEVHDLKTVTAEIEIPEKEIADVTVGLQVVLKVRAFPQSSFHGAVTAISPVVTEQNAPYGDRTALVVTQIDNASLQLKPGMSGNAKIYCGEQRAFDLVTRRIFRFIRVEFWSWW